MNDKTRNRLIEWAEKYNDPEYFREDPIVFPRKFARELEEGRAVLQDVEIAALFAAHFAWGRRSMIVRDCERLMDEMQWRPFDYVRAGDWRDDETSIHRTTKWSDVARICKRLKEWYFWHPSLESLTQDELRTTIFRQKSDPKAPNKKINMMRRWMVRDDGKVDLGLWKKVKKTDLIIPLDVHVHARAVACGLTSRKQKDLRTALQITDAFREIFPDDPCLGDFALFGYDIDQGKDA